MYKTITTSNNGGFGVEEEKKSQPAPLKQCKCGNTVNENQTVCPQCHNLTESALPILLD